MGLENFSNFSQSIHLLKWTTEIKHYVQKRRVCLDPSGLDPRRESSAICRILYVAYNMRYKYIKLLNVD